MTYLLNLVYVLLLTVAWPWLAWAAIRKGKYRQGWAAKFLGAVPRRKSEKKCLWLHAVSVGEVNLLRPLVDEIGRRHADWECVVSATTLAGHSLAKKKFPDHAVFYCPLDFSWAVRRAIRALRPEMLVLAELELWPNLIAAARRHGAKVAVVNGRLSDGSFRGYRRVGWLARRMFRSLDLVAAQNQEYAERFRLLGARTQTVHVTGSIKFDGALADRGNPATRALAALAGFSPRHRVFLVGSTQPPEESLAIKTYRRLRDPFPDLRLAIVPRHPERFEEVARLLAASGLPWRRRGDLDSTPDDGEGRILLVDRVGELGAWWGTAQIAFVGGSLGSRGGQNMIEPAAYGAAVCFGPRTENFRDVVSLLLRHDAAKVVRDGEELTEFVRQALADPAFAESLGEKAQKVVLAQRGATARTVDLLESLLEGAASRAPLAASRPAA